MKSPTNPTMEAKMTILIISIAPVSIGHPANDNVSDGSISDVAIRLRSDSDLRVILPGRVTIPLKHAA